MTEQDKEFMRRAIELAQNGIDSNDGGPFAAVVAIRDACTNLNSFQLDGCVIYTSCEPCPMCLGAIYWARPARVFFACNRGDAAGIGFDDDFIYDELEKSNGDRKLELTS